VGVDDAGAGFEGFGAPAPAGVDEGFFAGTLSEVKLEAVPVFDWQNERGGGLLGDHDVPQR